MTTVLNDILDDYSVEMTGKDVPSLNEARALLRPGTRVNVTYLGNEDFGMRRTAIRAAAGWGFTPVPHISARRLPSQQALEEFLGALRDDAAERLVTLTFGARRENPALNKAQALRKAMLEVMSDPSMDAAGLTLSDPSAWAPFVVVGDVD